MHMQPYNTINPSQKANLTRWVAALRGGEYTQSVGCLHYSEEYDKDQRERGLPMRDGAVVGGYCCLGVAEKVLLGDVLNPSRATLSRRSKEAFGLTDNDCKSLIALNDIRRASFSQIAQWVEKNVLTRPLWTPEPEVAA